VPTVAEQAHMPQEHLHPAGHETYNPVDGIDYRHPDRELLEVSDACDPP